MSTLGWKKPVCVRGHVYPERTKDGACLPCQKISSQERYRKNKEKMIRLVMERQKAHPEETRDYRRASRMGVSVREIRQAIKKAQNQCESCSKPLTHETLCVDHCHKTGKIRGVLCRFCNALEGMINKQENRVLLLLAYLERFEKE